MKETIRNPLGIIAIFATLIETVVSITLTTGLDKLISSSERLPVIWFIIIFPLLLLGVFVFLVIKFPTHLYSPRDFRTDASFLKANDTQIKEHLEADENAIEENSPIKPPVNVDSSKSEGKGVVLTIGEAMKAAEDQGITEAEKILGLPLRRNVIFRPYGSNDLIFDGLYQKGRDIKVVDVKYVPNDISSYYIKNAIDKAVKNYRIMENNGYRCSMILMLMVEDLTDSKRAIIKSISSNTEDIYVEIRPFNPPSQQS